MVMQDIDLYTESQEAFCILFKVLSSDGFMLAAGYTGQMGVMNWQDIGFGLSPILSNETIVMMFATETPVIVWTNKRFFFL